MEEKAYLKLQLYNISLNNNKIIQSGHSIAREKKKKKENI